ncbi:MAG: macrodomain Ter protein MatP [Vibrio sp.]
MKYQQLENLETGWKWQYLIRKWQNNDVICRFIDSSEVNASIERLHAAENQPELIESWIDQEMDPSLIVKLNQAIRAKRKRYFNAENQHTKKKSIDLEYAVWEKLSKKANELDSTLSDTIEYLLSEAASDEMYHGNED